MKEEFRYKGYLVTLKLVTFGNAPHHYCSYVKSDKFLGRDFSSEDYLANCTYHEKDEVGFDTAHGYNDRMTLFEKMLDAVEQAKNFVDTFEELDNLHTLA